MADTKSSTRPAAAAAANLVGATAPRELGSPSACRRGTSPDTEALRSGAADFEAMMDRLATISGETCFSKGPDVDGRDYVALVGAVEMTLRAMLLDGGAKYRQGFLRAMTNFLCITADGSLPCEDSPDSLDVTAASFEDCDDRVADTAMHLA